MSLLQVSQAKAPELINQQILADASIADARRASLLQNSGFNRLGKLVDCLAHRDLFLTCNAVKEPWCFDGYGYRPKWKSDPNVLQDLYYVLNKCKDYNASPYYIALSLPNFACLDGYYLASLDFDLPKIDGIKAFKSDRYANIKDARAAIKDYVESDLNIKTYTALVTQSGCLHFYFATRSLLDFCGDIVFDKTKLDFIDHLELRTGDNSRYNVIYPNLFADVGECFMPTNFYYTPVVKNVSNDDIDITYIKGKKISGLAPIAYRQGESLSALKKQAHVLFKMHKGNANKTYTDLLNLMRLGDPNRLSERNRDDDTIKQECKMYVMWMLNNYKLDKGIVVDKKTFEIQACNVAKSVCDVGDDTNILIGPTGSGKTRGWLLSDCDTKAFAISHYRSCSNMIENIVAGSVCKSYTMKGAFATSLCKTDFAKSAEIKISEVGPLIDTMRDKKAFYKYKEFLLLKKVLSESSSIKADDGWLYPDQLEALELLADRKLKDTKLTDKPETYPNLHILPANIVLDKCIDAIKSDTKVAICCGTATLCEWFAAGMRMLGVRDSDVFVATGVRSKKDAYKNKIESVEMDFDRKTKDKKVIIYNATWMRALDGQTPRAVFVFADYREIDAVQYMQMAMRTRHPISLHFAFKDGGLPAWRSSAKIAYDCRSKIAEAKKQELRMIDCDIMSVEIEEHYRQLEIFTDNQIKYHKRKRDILHNANTALQLFCEYQGIKIIGEIAERDLGESCPHRIQNELEFDGKSKAKNKNRDGFGLFKMGMSFYTKWQNNKRIRDLNRTDIIDYIEYCNLRKKPAYELSDEESLQRQLRSDINYAKNRRSATVLTQDERIDKKTQRLATKDHAKAHIGNAAVSSAHHKSILSDIFDTAGFKPKSFRAVDIAKLFADGMMSKDDDHKIANACRGAKLQLSSLGVGVTDKMDDRAIAGYFFKDGLGIKRQLFRKQVNRKKTSYYKILVKRSYKINRTLKSKLFYDKKGKNIDAAISKNPNLKQRIKNEYRRAYRQEIKYLEINGNQIEEIDERHFLHGVRVGLSSRLGNIDIFDLFDGEFDGDFSKEVAKKEANNDDFICVDIDI